MVEGSRPPGSPAENVRTSAPTEAAGDTILGGKYRIVREVGEGAFGRVYLALDPLLRRNVAIKELLAAGNKADAATYGRYLDRFQREARAAGGLTHPNIVTVYELAVDADANYYLVMEYVDGTDLRDLLDQVGTLPLERAITLTIEITAALDVIHDADIVHRDLKPANIMLTRRGAAKVTDFGIAQVGNESHRTQVAVGHPGTPMYMSPEQARGYGYIDGRSDLYSLGLILYEMVAGEPYARRRIPLAEKRPDLPSKLVAIVDKLMQEDPRDRYQSAEALLGDLRQLSTAPPPPPTGADASTVIEDGKTRVGTPPWGSGPAAPAPGVPSAYGGAASQSHPGAPAPYPPIAAATAVDGPTRVEVGADEGKTRVGQPGAPVPFTGAPPASSGPPAITGTGAYPSIAPPPGGPPSATSRRGLWIGLGGALLALIVVGGIVGLLASRGGSEAVATSTPRPVSQATPPAQASAAPTTVTANAPAPTPTAAAAPTATGVPTASAVPTVTVAPTTPPTTTLPAFVPTPAAQSFTDSGHRMQMRYPTAWASKPANNTRGGEVELTAPFNQGTFIVSIFPQNGTTSDEVQYYRTLYSSDAKITVSSTTVGGLPASKMDVIQSGGKNIDRWWVVNRNGQQFVFQAGVGVYGFDQEVNDVILSIKFI